jgi:hypothetical protein
LDTIDRDALINMIRVARTVEVNARDLQLQIENISSFADRWIAGELVVSIERVQEVVFELSRFRAKLEEIAGQWPGKETLKKL